MKKVTSKKRLVVNLVDEIGCPVYIEKVKEALKAGLEKACFECANQ